MKKLLTYLLGFITAVSIAYAGFTVVGELKGDTLYIGNASGHMHVDADGVMTFEGAGGFTTPYGMFSQTGNITVVDEEVAYPITYNVINDTGFGVSLSGGYEIMVPRAGDYEFCISAIASTDTIGKYMYVWAKIDGVNVPDSNTVVQLPNANTETVIALCAIFDMQADEGFSWWVGSDDAGSQLLSTAAGVSPTRPACPAVISTVKRISSEE